MMKCPPLPEDPIRSLDEALAYLGSLQPQYMDCAIRHDTLIEYVEKR